MKKTTLLSLLMAASMVALAACDTTTSQPTPSPSVSSSSKTSPDSSKAPISSTVSTTDPLSSTQPISSTTSSAILPSTSSTSSTPLPVVAVSIDGTTTEMSKGDTQDLTATVTGTTETGVTWSSSDDSVISVSTEGLVTVIGDVTEDTVIVITAVSVADTTKSAEYSITVKAPTVKAMEVSVTLTAFNDPTPLESVEEGSGAYKLRVAIENLPAGKTLSDCVITLPKGNAYAVFSQIETDVADHFITYTVLNAAVHSFDISVTCGTEVVTTPVTVNITRKDSLYTEINTVDDFLSMVRRPGNNTGRYILKANLDLGGAVITHAAGDVFNGVLDGAGHTVSNYVVGDEVGLLPVMGSGIARNIHLDGTIDASGNGWAGLLTKEIGNMAAVTDCLFVGVNVGHANSSWSNRNGIIAACVKGLVENVVAVNATDSEDGTVKYQTFSTFYAASRVDNTVLKNIYTNENTDPSGNNVALPPQTQPEWQMANDDPMLSNIHTGFGDFSTSTVSDFALPSTIWTLADGKMPVLAHYGEDPVVAIPELAVTPTSVSLKVGDTKDIKITDKNFGAAPTLTVEGDEGYDNIVSVEASATETGLYTLTALAVGTTNIKFKARENNVDYYTPVIAITVTEAGSTGQYEIPAGAVEITSAQAFLDFFSDANKSDNQEQSIYLTQDLDFTGIQINMLSTGVDYKGIIEGQGHALTGMNLTTGDALFHFFGGTMRNLDFEVTSTLHPGSGILAYSNTGTFENLNLRVTLGATNTVGLVLTSGDSKGQAGNPIYKNIHIDFNFTAVGSNTIYPICQNDGAANITIENCTYYLVGNVVTEPAGVFVTSNSNIVYRAKA